MSKLPQQMAEAPRQFAAFLSVRREDGVTALEYGLIAALIALAIITAVTLLGTKLAGTFNTVAGKMP